MSHTENSGEGGVPSSSLSTYTTANSITTGDIIESNKAMFSALTEVFQKTLTSGHFHRKVDIESKNENKVL